MKGHWISYSDAELAWIKARSSEDRPQTHAAFVAEFGRSDVSLQNLNALCKRKGWLTGRTGRFDPGAVPVNKGKPCPPGQGGRHPNAQRTQFRKGARTGKAAELYQPIGTERISEDGYRERKVHDGLPMQSRWQLVHRVEWEKVNGPIPAGHCLKCLDGDRLNTNPANWEVIPRAVLPHLSARFGMRYDEAEPELKPTIMAVAKLKHAVKKARRRAEQC